MLLELQQSGHLLTGCDNDIRKQEQRVLVRLQRIPKPTFLQEYDQLFRWVSLWLLDRGYRLSNFQPHQVLALVCEQFATRAEVREMIRCRHLMKHDGIPPSKAGHLTLIRLISVLDKSVK